MNKCGVVGKESKQPLSNELLDLRLTTIVSVAPLKGLLTTLAVEASLPASTFSMLIHKFTLVTMNTHNYLIGHALSLRQ